MQEIQRFNKVLKSLVLLGDLILLNLLLWGFNFFWVPVSGVFIAVLSFRV